MGAGTLEAPAGICQLDQASITGLVQTMKNAREQTMWKLVTTLVAFVSLGIATGTQAEEWPTRPLTMINPFAAGGPNDVLARLFAQRMGEILGQPIVIENIGGAGGMNGADRVAKAVPDGYTFLLGTVGTQAQNQTLFRKPAYNSTTDFAAVALMVEAPLVLVARKDLPVQSMKEFVAYAKANREKDAVRLRRHGISDPSRLRAGQHGDRARHRPRSLSRRQPRDAGPDERPRRLSLRHHHHGETADRRRRGEGDRHPDQRALAGT